MAGPPTLAASDRPWSQHVRKAKTLVLFQWNSVRLRLRTIFIIPHVGRKCPKIKKSAKHGVYADSGTRCQLVPWGYPRFFSGFLWSLSGDKSGIPLPVQPPHLAPSS